MQKPKSFAMKSRQLLSIVFSLIMFTGVSAGSAAFAESDEYYDDLEDQLEDFCYMTDEQRVDFFSNNPDMAEYDEKLTIICDIEDEDNRYKELDDFIDAVIPETRDVDDFDNEFDELENEFEDESADDRYDLDDLLDRYCDMTDEDKRAFVAEHDKAEDHVEKMNRYCSLDGEDAREDFIRDHIEEYKDHMKDKVHDKISDHMDYDRYCSMASSDRLSEITDVAKLDRISKWCDMTPEERDEYKREHHDEMKDKVHDKMSDCMAGDCPMKDKVHDKMMKFSDESKRLKAMIMEKHDISDERIDEIKMKFKEKYGDITDEKKSELKMKFKDHMATIKIKMTDERKSEIHDRLAEMKEFKAELREKSSDMTDEQKQELREEFIEKAKDLQLAWISPRTQMTAGIDATEVECREGFSLVMKASNGVAMCLKADTALKMIDRGIVVPAI